MSGKRFSDAVREWGSVLGAFSLYYAVLAAFTAALFVIVLNVVLGGVNTTQPCPFRDLPLTNCNGLCAGPPLLMRAWQNASSAAERDDAAQRIEAWISGAYSFTWNSSELITESEWLDFDGVNVTNQFYRQLGCCKLKDAGVPLMQQAIDDRANWDDAFNNNDDRVTVRCNNWLELAKSS